MAVINKYTAHTIEPDILSRLNVDQAGDVVSAETWVALWELVLHLLAKYNEHFVDIYRTLEELGTEVDTCIKRIDSLEDQYQSLEERMGNLETSWSALQDAYNKVAGHYEEIKHIQESLESGFVHYGKEPPATNFIKLWVMPTQGIPSLITSWGENDILATNYNYASAKLIKDSLNTKVNKAGDTMTGPLNFNCLNTYALYGGNPAYREWYVNWDGDFKLWTGIISTSLDIGNSLRVGGSQYSFTINTDRNAAAVTLHNLKLTGLQHPTAPDDAAPRQYVDASHLPAIKEYVDPKIASLEENKFRHTEYYVTQHTVCVDTPTPGVAYYTNSLGLVKDTTYHVECITASGELLQFYLKPLDDTASDWGTPAGSLVLTDSEEEPNITIIDCCNEQWCFDDSVSQFYSDSINRTEDPVARITIYGVNSRVPTYDKLPEECLDISDEFIDGHKLTKETVPLNRLKGPELLETIEIPEGETVDAIDISLTGVNKDYAQYRLVGFLQCAPATDDKTFLSISLKTGSTVYQNLFVSLSDTDRASSLLNVCFDLELKKENELVTIVLNVHTAVHGDYPTIRCVKKSSHFMNKITLTGPFSQSVLSPTLCCYGYNKLTE